ncbi:MAG TPA: PAS domain-containing protein [Rhodospirillales bacterium]|nr:PAS domain-containing protein [Rhodospirillales bacterium]
MVLTLSRPKERTRPARRVVTPTGRERFFREEDTIVSKTDVRGRITYANEVFIAVSDYSEAELIGAPHSIVRHPAMPRCIFQLMWEEIAAGREVFAFVVNLAKNGDHYWVFAHVCPTFDEGGRIIGYHSSRRVPSRPALREVEPLYRELLAVEQAAPDRKAGLAAGRARLDAVLEPYGGSANAFAFALLGF